ncbi:MAG: hypothetical protein V4760_07740 [Bdellovibrionota bacterium]
MENQQTSRELGQQIEAASTTIGTLISLGKKDLAENVANVLYSANPNDIDLKDFYASALYRLKRQIPLAASLALEVYRHRPREMNRLQGTSRCLLLAGRAPEAEQLVREAINAEPHQLDLQIELSYLVGFQGQFDSSILILKNIIARNPNHVVAHFHMGWHDVYNGRVEEGLAKIALGRRVWTWGTYGMLPAEAAWDGISPFTADHIFLIGEGGVGDQIMTFGMANALAERSKKRVILVTRPELVEIAKRSVASERVLITGEIPKSASAPWVAGLEFGKMIPEGRPPFPLGPYLKVDSRRAETWKRAIATVSASKKVVGLRWSGDVNHELESHRRLPSEDVIAFAKSFPNVVFVPLYAAGENEEMPKADNIVKLPESILDWEDTAAIIGCVDAVVSSCTSSAHLSAALGRPTWVLNPIWPYYTWAQKDESSYWYGDHVRVLRQKKYRDWRGPFSDLRAEFAKKFSS